MVYFTIIENDIHKRNIDIFSKLNIIKVLDIKNIKSIDNENYLYLNPNIMAVKKMKLKKNELEATYLKLRELVFYHLNAQQMSNFITTYNIELLNKNYYNKKLNKKAIKLFTDISNLKKFDDIFNYVPDKFYATENKINDNRVTYHHNIEYIIEEYYKQDLNVHNIKEEIIAYNKNFKEQENKENKSKIKRILKPLIIFRKSMLLSKVNNYQLISTKNDILIFVIRKDTITNIKIDNIKVTNKIISLFNFKLIKINKKEMKKVCGISGQLKLIFKENEENLIKKLPYRGTNYNNIKALYYTQEYIYYLRNTTGGKLLVQKKVREYFETPKYSKKIKLAKFVALFMRTNKVLIYEKQISQFEESGSILFKNILKNKNVYYLLKKDTPKYKQLKQKYGNKIIEPSEFKYLLNFFSSKYIIGTEVPGHIFTIRSPYKPLRTELIKEKHKFIFLQHGVMYALSLNTPSRNFFKKGKLYSPYKIISSSYEESLHLQKYGYFNQNDILNTGLPIFDNKNIKQDANKITLMLTWRPWDELKDIKQTTYYQAVNNIVNNINDIEILNNLKIVFHPKLKYLIKEDMNIYKYIYSGSIDELLNETDTLISDYSSVVFDGFNRGSKVIFWWVQKEACLEKYNNTLLLNEQNVFGDIVEENKNLQNIIKQNYLKDKNKQYEEKYQQIVEFNDNNTTKLIKSLIKLGVINE